jgi:AcrR family transcriptional regulator
MVATEVRGGPGRPRDPHLEARVFAAALALYSEAGWSGFSFDAVARRAGVGKAPLYLRWKSKEDLLLAALSSQTSSIRIPDSGDLRADLTEYASRLLTSQSSPEGWAFLRIHLEATVIPTLHARFSTEIVTPHVEGARALLYRAVERGDLPEGAPIDLLLDSLYGAIVTRMILCTPVQRAELARHPGRYAGPLVNFVLGGWLSLQQRVNYPQGRGHGPGRALPRPGPAGTAARAGTPRPTGARWPAGTAAGAGSAGGARPAAGRAGAPGDRRLRRVGVGPPRAGVRGGNGTAARPTAADGVRDIFRCVPRTPYWAGVEAATGCRGDGAMAAGGTGRGGRPGRARRARVDPARQAGPGTGDAGR